MPPAQPTEALASFSGLLYSTLRLHYRAILMFAGLVIRPVPFGTESSALGYIHHNLVIMRVHLYFAVFVAAFGI